ncbi:hypothetical protein C0Q70_02393 [Pomacea canaliculata]|uniref:Uncharacterized protein n=1 Tax=Pomacea canaliculata TaxID=400727 RepID=A0A2T7PPT2_POMCA|nr:hypothetical protein C0Q70_02393 [Pomacea canaliculata]
MIDHVAVSLLATSAIGVTSSCVTSAREWRREVINTSSCVRQTHGRHDPLSRARCRSQTLVRLRRWTAGRKQVLWLKGQTLGTRPQHLQRHATHFFTDNRQKLLTEINGLFNPRCSQSTHVTWTSKNFH